jgi:glycyl-tRNA synthetase beta chain
MRSEAAMVEFLLELLSEEIPARMQARAAEDLKRLVCNGLTEAGITFEGAQGLATPRRLSLVVVGLPDKQPDVTEEKRGPRVGAPDKAIEGFLRGNGLASLDDAEIRDTGKGEFYFAVTSRSGVPTADALVPIVKAAIAGLPWPKSMRWGSHDVRWVRPLHNILAVVDGRPIAYSFSLGADDTESLTANARTTGHRFLAPDWFEVSGYADYRSKLANAKVMVEPDFRRALIESELTRLADQEGLTVKTDHALLDEVTGLVEWPVVLMGSIDAAFMDVPPEVLTTAMRTHQKYFSLVDGNGRLAPRFICVANMETPDGGAAIVAGNERVLRARLSDAKFFWDQDRRIPLADRVEGLSERVFHAKLGSDRERVERLVALARSLSQHTNADGELAARAALLAKADLTTDMVGEFPELQGLMGRYYALHDGEEPTVAEAVATHYAPQGPNDACPKDPIAAAVALADKIDTLVGFFAIDEKPTGSRDPFALGRAALGVIRIIIENDLRLPLRPIFADALALYPEGVCEAASPEIAEELLAFFADRLKVHLKGEGVRHDLISAVFARGAPDDFVRMLMQVDALKGFLGTEDGANLLTAYKRASNIVRIEETKDKKEYGGGVDEGLLTEMAEKDLHAGLLAAQKQIRDALDAEDFSLAMAHLAALRAPVDAFFDEVTVNSPDPELRVNRLRMLSQIRAALGGVADFSLVEG